MIFLYIIRFIWITSFVDIISTVQCRTTLTALNDSPHTLQLYLQVNNEHRPSPKDPALSDIRIRKQICKDITNSGFFYYTGLISIAEENLLRELKHPNDDVIFHQIYHRVPNSRNESLFTYRNSYKQLKFFVRNNSFYLYRFTEYVFVCLLKDLLDRDRRVIPYYVSKEYNVAPSAGLYKPGRFIFGELVESDYSHVIFVEEPTETYGEAVFNVELYYLRMRNHFSPARSDDIDPLCKLVSRKKDDPNNQHYRFCVAVSRSADFEHKVTYPSIVTDTHSCSIKEISFRTREAIKEAAGRYYERMFLCKFSWVNPRERKSPLYISRAYNSNAVFIYRYDPLNKKIYLTNLSVNVSIADELNSLDFVEY